MKRTRLLIFSAVLLLSLAFVGMALAADYAQQPPPLAGGGTSEGATPAGIGTGEINSLSGSYVVFDPSIGGDSCYTPGTPQTFCFKAESFTNDWEFVYNVWEKFPINWVVNDAYMIGTPSCTGDGSFGTFSWSFETNPYEVVIHHLRNHAPSDDCVAYYCFDVVSGAGAPYTLESWYWDGDGYAGAPHHPCSSDNYTPASMASEPCDQAVNPQAAVPACALPSDVLLVDDDDNNPDVRSYYMDILDTLGLTYDIWDTDFSDDDEPDTAFLENYQAAVWFTGDANYGPVGPGSDGEPALAAWLDSGAARIVGDWTVSYDWNCDGSSESTVLHFYPDGTFTEYGNSGTWTQYNDQIEWVFIGGTTFTGTINGDTMDGTMVSFDETTGCWNADRIVMAGSVTIVSGERDASGEPSENAGIAHQVYIDVMGGSISNRCLLLSSQDYLHVRDLTPFMQEHLGVGNFYSDVGHNYVIGDGWVYSGLGPYTLDPINNYSDVLTPTATAEVAFASNKGKAGVDKFGATYFTTFLGYPLEAIPNVPDRADVMLAFLNACGVLPDIHVSPISLEMTLLPDETITHTLTIRNAGSKDLEWNLTDDATWLSEDPTSGVTQYAGVTDVIVTFDSTDLTEGVYTGIISITSNDPDIPSLSLPVVLNVVEPGVLLTPPELEASGCENSDVTYSLTLINNTGADDTFTLDYASSWPIVGPQELSVVSFASASFDVSVHIPCHMVSDVATVTATGNGYSASSTLTTSVSEAVLTEWESIANIIGPGRQRIAGASVNGKVYVLGGQTPSGLADTVQEFDPASGMWATKTGLMPTPASNSCAAAIGSDIYFPGGWLDPNHLLNTLQVYHVPTDSWETITSDPLPAPKAAAGCAVVDGKLYVFGGLTVGFAYTNTTDVYDPNAPAGTRWTSLSNKVYSLGYMGSTVINNKVFVVGGRDFNYDDLSYVEVFDPENNLWHTITNINIARHSPGAWVWGDNLVVCGGGYLTPLNSCEMYDTTQGYNGVWINLPQSLITGRKTFAYVSLPEGLYAIAGFSGDFLVSAERLPFLECPGCPDIEVFPLSLQATQLPDTLATQPITICNVGDADLTWMLAEFPAIQTVNSGATTGTSEWLYKDEEGIMLPVNGGGESLVYPAAYRWKPDAPSAMNVLIYADDPYHPSPNTFLDQALQHLGIAYTAFYGGNWSGFISALTSGPSWDMVLVGNDDYGDISWMAPLNTYIQGGGKAIVHTYSLSNNPGAQLWNTMGVTYIADDLDPPAPIYWWDPSHPFFNLPESVPELTSLTGGRSTIAIGQYIEPLPGFKALAGYTTPGPDPNQAALILGNDNRTVFKGFLDGQNDADLDSDGTLDGVELWIDLINWVGFGSGGDIPWLSEDPIYGTILAGTCTEPSGTITLDSNGLTPDIYTATLDINSNDPEELIVTVPVTLTVVVPGIEVDPPSLEIMLLPNAIGKLTFTISNIGGWALDWSLNDSAPWLSEDLSSGTILPDGSNEVVVTFVSTGLAPGTHITNIVITSNDPDEPSLTMPVTLTVKNYSFFLPLTQRR